MFISLSGVTATGTGTTTTFATPRDVTGIQLTFTGDPTAVVVTLEASIDGRNFYVIDTHTASAGEITAQGGVYSVVDIPAKHLRLALTTLTAGTSPTVTGTLLV